MTSLQVTLGGIALVGASILVLLSSVHAITATTLVLMALALCILVSVTSVVMNRSQPEIALMSTRRIY